MKPTTINDRPHQTMRNQIYIYFFAILLSSIAAETAVSPDSVSEITKLKGSKEDGSRWIKFHPGVIHAATKCRLAKLTAGEGEIQTDLHEVKAAKIEDFKKWAEAAFSPILNSSPKDDGQYSEEAVFSMILYMGDVGDPRSVLLRVPLADVFDGFSEKDFSKMVERWCK